VARSATDIQADLDAAYQSRRNTLVALSYRTDTGQGSQQVQRSELASIQRVIADLESELEEAQNTGGGMIRMSFDR